MRVFDDLRNSWRWLGVAGQVFVVALLGSWTIGAFGGPSWLGTLFGLVAIVAGFLFGLRLIRHFVRQSIWRLRNRLMVAYAFIALVPILLIVMLAGLAAWALSGQIAVYLVTSEFNRRLMMLQGAQQSVLRSPPAQRTVALQRLGSFLEESYPGFEMLVVDTEQRRFPESSALELPSEEWKDTRGVVVLKGEFFAWANVSIEDARSTIVVPLTRELLRSLVPNLGDISILSFDRDGTGKGARIRGGRAAARGAITQTPALPPPENRFDLEVLWGAPVTVANYKKPDSPLGALFTVRSRISAVWRILLSERADWDNSLVLAGIIFIGVLFLIVEVIALVIGISLSRSITLAVHNLYEGTERVMEGDFSQRILVKGKDQLAALGHSFNRMTENLERLLKVAKEKERYEAELEIAREIQKQLYPSSVPDSPNLRLTALYKPARMVSGDYYDYRRVGGEKIAVAIGDVAGKGISAALLMATVQSGFRSQLQQCGANGEFHTSRIVSLLNEQLHANTPPEKFATFFFGVFDEGTNTLHYTNAGHLQPILVREGEATRLEVDGMVIGAFPFARYGESCVELHRGDLLMCFTDGISEPENEYGEMFGEERLVELAVKNAARPEEEIIHMVIEAVEKWTGSPELQDDMTLLLVRRK